MWSSIGDRKGLTYRAAAMDESCAMAEALLVAPPGQLPARDWLVSLLGSRAQLTSVDRHALLSGRSPAAVPSIGRIVCFCFNVGVNQLGRCSRHRLSQPGGYRKGTWCRHQLRLVSLGDQDDQSMQVVSKRSSDPLPTRIRPLGKGRNQSCWHRGRAGARLSRPANGLGLILAYRTQCESLGTARPRQPRRKSKSAPVSAPVTWSW